MKTASQHNAQSTGQVDLPPAVAVPAMADRPAAPVVTISESDPGIADADLDASAPMSNKLNLRLQYKGTREAVIAAIENDRTVPRELKVWLLAKARVAESKHDSIRVDQYVHPHKDGLNDGGTACDH